MSQHMKGCRRAPEDWKALKQLGHGAFAKAVADISAESGWLGSAQLMKREGSLFIAKPAALLVLPARGSLAHLTPWLALVSHLSLQ